MRSAAENGTATPLITSGSGAVVLNISLTGTVDTFCIQRQQTDILPIIIIAVTVIIVKTVKKKKSKVKTAAKK